MMPAGRGRVLLIMLVAVLALAVGETLLSRGMKQVGRAGGGWLDQAMAVARNAWVGAGLLLLLVHVGLYMLALQGRRPQLRAAAHRGVVSAGRPAGAILSSRKCRHRALGRHAPDHRRRGDRRARRCDSADS